jgi:flavin reductase (DIM6/NTAB) family NADH-FMN oxidoreductase RutF
VANGFAAARDDGSMSDEPFDELMGSLDHPMIIVTTAAGGSRAGCLVGFHSQCGIDPAAFAVWLSKANHTYRIAALADTFAVHFLAEEHHGLAALFGTTTEDEVDKFSLCAWTGGPDGVPLLDECRDRFIGRRVAWIDVGADHACLVLDPVDGEHDPASRRLTFQQVRDLDAGHDAEERQRPR